MTEHENNPSKQLRGSNPAARPLWPADKAIIRIVAIVQLLFALYWFLVTPFVFNYGGAAANPAGFQLWIIFWLAGIVSASCLLTGHLWARVFALLWNVLAAWGLLARNTSGGEFLEAWTVLAVAYLTLTAGVPLSRQLRHLAKAPESRKRLAIGLALASAAVLAVVAFYLASHTEDALIRELNSSSERARCSAAEALSKKIPAPRAALSRLEASLENTSCIQFGQDKLPDYIEAIGGIDPFLEVMKVGGRFARQKAAWRLRWMAREYLQRSQDSVRAFLRGLNNDDHLVRQASAEGLGLLYAYAASAAPELEKALDDPDLDVRQAAVHSLNKVHSFEGLKLALTNSDEKVRLSAIELLGGKSEGEFIPSDGHQDFPDPGLSEAGRQQLAKVYPPPTFAEQQGYGIEALSLLVSALNDPSEVNSAAAAKGLRNLGRRALPALQPLATAALESASPTTRTEALHALKAIGQEGLPTIAKAVHDPEKSVRDYAITLVASYEKKSIDR